MDVHPGHGILHRADDIEVEIAVEVGVDSPLEADLRRTAVPGLDARALGDVVEVSRYGGRAG